MQLTEATMQKWSFSYGNINMYTNLETLKMFIKVFLKVGWSK